MCYECSSSVVWFASPRPPLLPRCLWAPLDPHNLNLFVWYSAAGVLENLWHKSVTWGGMYTYTAWPITSGLSHILKKGGQVRDRSDLKLIWSRYYSLLKWHNHFKWWTEWNLTLYSTLMLVSAYACSEYRFLNLFIFRRLWIYQSNHRINFTLPFMSFLESILSLSFDYNTDFHHLNKNSSIILSSN